jgi:hypothetical protein
VGPSGQRPWRGAGGGAGWRWPWASWAAARGAGLPSGVGPRLAVVLGELEVVLG